MTIAQILAIAGKYHEKLAGRGIEPKKFIGRAILPTAQQALAHSQWVVETLVERLQKLQVDPNSGGNLDEAQRMLGFVQGVMWAVGQRTLDKIEDDNKHV